MVKNIVKGERIFSKKAQSATEADKQVITDLLDTLKANKNVCVGMAANMIGINKAIIAVSAGSFHFDQNFKKQHGKYTGWTAQIIQHEVDHCNGVVI